MHKNVINSGKKGHNNIGVESAIAFRDALNANYTLQKIHLCLCFVNLLFNIWNSLFEKSWLWDRRRSLKNNVWWLESEFRFEEICPMFWKNIFFFFSLSKKKWLIYCEIAGVRFSCLGITHLFEALKTNTSLESLTLSKL